MLPSLSRLHIGVANTSIVPPEECPICYEPLYTCGPVEPSLEPSSRFRRIVQYVTRDDTWPRCKHYRWKADKRVMMLTCGHFMHTDCLLPWFAQRAVCPVCVTPIDMDDLGSALNVRFFRDDESYFAAFDRTTYALRFTISDSYIHYYEGAFDQERQVRTVLTDGTIFYYEGAMGQERRVQTVFSDGDIWYYEGDKGQERHVRTKTSNGAILYYEGAKDQERLVRQEFDGTIFYYEGAKGQEELVTNGIIPSLVKKIVG